MVCQGLFLKMNNIRSAINALLATRDRLDKTIEILEKLEKEERKKGNHKLVDYIRPEKQDRHGRIQAWLVSRFSDYNEYNSWRLRITGPVEYQLEKECCVGTDGATLNKLAREVWGVV